MLSIGISLVMYDDPAMLPEVLKRLHVSEGVALDKMIERLDTLYDEVFTVHYQNVAQAERLLSAYNTRRAVIVHQGKMNVYGRDLGWAKACVAGGKITPIPDPAGDLNRALDKVMGQMPQGIAVADDDRDDPYESLGYARR